MKIKMTKIFSEKIGGFSGFANQNIFFSCYVNFLNILGVRNFFDPF